MLRPRLAASGSTIMRSLGPTRPRTGGRSCALTYAVASTRATTPVRLARRTRAGPMIMRTPRDAYGTSSRSVRYFTTRLRPVQLVTPRRRTTGRTLRMHRYLVLCALGAIALLTATPPTLLGGAEAARRRQASPADEQT